jgi:hypothetical protein
MDEKTRESAAHRLGMKPSEIVAVADAQGGAVITTHDGQTVYAPNDGGEPRPWDGPLPIVPITESARARVR